jgi:hypothetical protein
MNSIRITAIVFAAMLSLSVASSANADSGSTRDPGINRRQHRQQERIAQGIRSGELTTREAAILEFKEARVARLERRLKSDGSLTLDERARLQRDLNQLSAEIYHQKHDDQVSH